MRKTLVPAKTTVNAVVGGISDLFQCVPEEDKWHEEGVVKGFQDCDHSFYRIPSADTGKDIFFDDLEVLARFVGMPTPLQRAFLLGIRQSMMEARVDILHLTIQWSETETKTLKIKGGYSLDIYTKDHDIHV